MCKQHKPSHSHPPGTDLSVDLACWLLGKNPLPAKMIHSSLIMTIFAQVNLCGCIHADTPGLYIGTWIGGAFLNPRKSLTELIALLLQARS